MIISATELLEWVSNHPERKEIIRSPAPPIPSSKWWLVDVNTNAVEGVGKDIYDAILDAYESEHMDDE